MNLSPRQEQILSLIVEGLVDKEIARSLGVSPRTVDSHLQRLFERYRVHSRASLVAKWLLEGGVPTWRGSGPAGHPAGPAGTQVSTGP